MQARDFIFWLQGHFEMNPDDNRLSEAQVQLIRTHLNLVLKHDIGPSMGDEKHQEELKQIHQGPTPPQPTGPIVPRYPTTGVIKGPLATPTLKDTLIC